MDKRNYCKNFLANICPNNCHYSDECNKYEEKNHDNLLNKWKESGDNGKRV